jgi:hypothetical protein
MPLRPSICFVPPNFLIRVHMQDLQFILELDLIQRAVSAPARNDRLSSVSTTAKICQPILT